MSAELCDYYALQEHYDVAQRNTENQYHSSSSTFQCFILDSFLLGLTTKPYECYENCSLALHQSLKIHSFLCTSTDYNLLLWIEILRIGNACLHEIELHILLLRKLSVHFLLPLLCSCEGLPVHIPNKRDVAGLLGNSVCSAFYVVFLEDKIQTQKISWCCHLYCWSCPGDLFRCTCCRSIK